MKTKKTFYGLLIVVLAGSMSLISLVESTKVTDVVTVAFLGNSYGLNEGPCEGCDEEEDIGELKAEAELPDYFIAID